MLYRRMSTAPTAKYSVKRMAKSATPQRLAGAVTMSAPYTTSPDDHPSRSHDGSDHRGSAHRERHQGPPLPAVSGVLVHESAALANGEVHRLAGSAGGDH